MLHTGVGSCNIYESQFLYHYRITPRKTKLSISHLVYLLFYFCSNKNRTRTEYRVQSTEHVYMRYTKGESKTRKHNHQPNSYPTKKLLKAKKKNGEAISNIFNLKSLHCYLFFSPKSRQFERVMSKICTCKSCAPFSIHFNANI